MEIENPSLLKEKKTRLIGECIVIYWGALASTISKAATRTSENVTSRCKSPGIEVESTVWR